MHLIEFFYTQDSDACMETLDLLEETVEEYDDVVVISYDVESDEGLEKIKDREITSVPTMIVDGHRVIRGVPHDTEQIFGDNK